MSARRGSARRGSARGGRDGRRAPRVDLRIDELVVDGLPVRDRAALGAAVERELARLIAERGVPAALARGGGVASLAGRRFAAVPGMDPAALGARIAGAVYGGFGR